MATPNLNEEPVAGTTWNRCSLVRIDNPYAGQPTITVHEEKMLLVEGVPPMSLSRVTFAQPFDPAAVIDMRDPTTDELLGATISQSEVYAILYSLYRQMAVPPEVPPEIEP